MTTRGTTQARLLASAALDAWRQAAAEGRDVDARIHAAEVETWLAAGAPPEWTAAESRAFGAWVEGLPTMSPDRAEGRA